MASLGHNELIWEPCLHQHNEAWARWMPVCRRRFERNVSGAFWVRFHVSLLSSQSRLVSIRFRNTRNKPSRHLPLRRYIVSKGLSELNPDGLKMTGDSFKADYPHCKSLEKMDTRSFNCATIRYASGLSISLWSNFSIWFSNGQHVNSLTLI